MKKKYLLSTLAAVAALTVTGCSSSKYTKVSNSKEAYLAELAKEKNITLETYQELYDRLFAGSGNSQLQSWIIEQIVQLEGIDKEYSSSNPNGRAKDINERFDEYMENWLKNTSYYIDHVFSERKLVISLRTLGYNIPCDNGYFTSPSKNINPYSLGEDYDPTVHTTITNASDYRLTLRYGSQENLILKCNYDDYKIKAALPSIYQDLVKEQYIKEKQLDDLIGPNGNKRVRELKTFELAFDSNDPNVAIFIDLMNESLLDTSADIDFSKFAPRNNAIPLAEDSNYYKNILSTTEDKLEFDNYEKIWKIYRKSLVAKEIDKMGYLGPLAEETEASKLATDEEKKNLVNKYSGNNTYTTSEGQWLANDEIDRAEYVKTKVYTTDSSPFNTTINNFIFNKAREEVFKTKITTIGEQNFILSFVNSDDLYQIDNTGSRYIFFELLNTFEDYNSVENKNEAAKAFLERTSVDTVAIVFYLHRHNLVIGDKDFYDFVKANYPKYFEEPTEE